MSLVVATEPTSLVAVEDQCARIEAWAETCANVAELRDAMNKCSAISEYLRLTATEGTARVETTKRRLEMRVGLLLGPTRQGQKSDDGPLHRDEEVAGMHDSQASTFRAMAADPDTVEEVISASTDTAPPSRRKVMDAIKAKRKPTEEDVLKKLSRAAVAARVEKAKQMAAEGYTSRQIADAIEVTPGSFPEFRKRHGVDVPADAIVGKTRLLDADRMVAETVHTLEGAAMTVGLIGDPREAGLNPARIEDWATSLRSSLTVLTQFSKQLKETAQ
jgi:hypothetical protein